MDNDGRYEGLFYMLNAVEGLLIVISISTFSISAYIVIENPLLHVNFMRLYQCVYAEFLIFSLSRLIKIVGVLFGVMQARVDRIYILQGPLALLESGFFGWLQIFRLGVSFCIVLCFFHMLIERILATIMLKTYEKWINNCFSFTLILSHILEATIGTLLFFTEKIPFSIEIGLIISGVIFCAIAIIIMRVYNVRQYQISRLEKSGYLLSEKFQISENIRSLELLWRSYLSTVVFMFLIVGLFSLTSYVGDYLSKRLIFFAFNYTITIYAIIASSLFVISTHVWRRALKNKLFHLKKILYKPRISAEVHKQVTIEKLNHLKTLDGQKMVYTIDEEGEMYFHQLIKEWNKPKIQANNNK